MNSSEYIKKERPFFLEVFRHTGHSEHLLFTADLLPKRRNAQNLTPLYGFGAILGVFFRYERLCFSGGILYRQPFKSRCLSLPGNKKAPYCDMYPLYWTTSKEGIFICVSTSREWNYSLKVSVNMLPCGMLSHTVRSALCRSAILLAMLRPRPKWVR